MQTSMTMQFSAAAAQPLLMPLRRMCMVFATEVEFLMKSNVNQAPAILSLILAKFVLDKPTIVFNDAAANKRVHQAEMWSDKETFDDVFCATSSSDRLTCRFEIQSVRRSFHPIKMGVWDVLQNCCVFVKTSAAPVKKISLVTMGFGANVHPSFASSHVFHAQICESIQETTTPTLLYSTNHVSATNVLHQISISNITS
jgi:hypothetical protein